MDGSTDTSLKEQETLFVRSCKQGNIISRFLCIGEPKSTSANDLRDFVLEKMKHHDIIENSEMKLVGFGADGASNMMGNRTGLATQLKSSHPHMIINHCLAHRMELAYKDAMKDSKQYKKVQTLM